MDLDASLPSLSQLREEIDRIDNIIHKAIVERGEIISKVIEVKNRSGDKGSAFRPNREAELMRSIVLKNPGRWPIEMLENIWRIILSTSTYTQRAFSVHADVSAGEIPIRESMRFHFGFSTPFVAEKNAIDVIKSVENSEGDLGIFCVNPLIKNAWWRGLEDPPAPKIIARLPFVERENHPASLPVFVIAKPQNEGLAREIIIASLHVENWKKEANKILYENSCEIISSIADAYGAKLLVAHCAKTNPEIWVKALENAKCGIINYREIGCHANRLVL